MRASCCEEGDYSAVVPLPPYTAGGLRSLGSFCAEQGVLGVLLVPQGTFDSQTLTSKDNWSLSSASLLHLSIAFLFREGQSKQDLQSPLEKLSAPTTSSFQWLCLSTSHFRSWSQYLLWHVWDYQLGFHANTTADSSVFPSTHEKKSPQKPQSIFCSQWSLLPA